MEYSCVGVVTDADSRINATDPIEIIHWYMILSRCTSKHIGDEHVTLLLNVSLVQQYYNVLSHITSIDYVLFCCTWTTMTQPKTTLVGDSNRLWRRKQWLQEQQRHQHTLLHSKQNIDNQLNILYRSNTNNYRRRVKEIITQQHNKLLSHENHALANRLMAVQHRQPLPDYCIHNSVIHRNTYIKRSHHRDAEQRIQQKLLNTENQRLVNRLINVRAHAECNSTQWKQHAAMHSDMLDKFSQTPKNCYRPNTYPQYNPPGKFNGPIHSSIIQSNKIASYDNREDYTDLHDNAIERDDDEHQHARASHHDTNDNTAIQYTDPSVQSNVTIPPRLPPPLNQYQPIPLTHTSRHHKHYSAPPLPHEHTNSSSHHNNTQSHSPLTAALNISSTQQNNKSLSLPSTTHTNKFVSYFHTHDASDIVEQLHTLKVQKPIVPQSNHVSTDNRLYTIHTLR